MQCKYCGVPSNGCKPTPHHRNKGTKAKAADEKVITKIVTGTKVACASFIQITVRTNARVVSEAESKLARTNLAEWRHDCERDLKRPLEDQLRENEEFVRRGLALTQGAHRNVLQQDVPGPVQRVPGRGGRTWLILPSQIHARTPQREKITQQGNEPSSVGNQRPPQEGSEADDPVTEESPDLLQWG